MRVCVCARMCVCVSACACVCAEGAVSKRQWPGWSCTNGRREGCVSERAPCVVCCAPVAEGRHPLSPPLALAAGLPRGRPAALFDGATEVLGGPCPRCLRALWWGIDEAGTWAAKILQHTATLPWGCGRWGSCCVLPLKLLLYTTSLPLGAPLAQCGRSATIWAYSHTGDPYFVTLGASLLPLA